jgi:hypothetical protein
LEMAPDTVCLHDGAGLCTQLGSLRDLLIAKPGF